MPLSRPLRIAILIPSLHGGGAEFVAVEWGKYLKSRGNQVVFFTTHDFKSPSELHERLVGSWFGARVLALKRILKEREFDVLLSLAPHWNLLSLLGTFGFRKRPAVIISGRTIEIEARRAGNNKRIELILARLFYRRADAFVAISHATAAEAQAEFKIPTKRIWIVPNPALGKFQSRDIDAHEREECSEPTLNIAVPGRLTPSKRPELAIEVALRCSEISGRPVRLHFFGTGSEEARARAAAPDDLQVTFHGWVENWFNIPPEQTIVLLPSRLEGFANVLVEATAAGFPTVATSRALGVSDAIIPEITGCLSISDSVDDFAAAVLAADGLNPPSEVKQWLHRFTPESSGIALMSVIESVVADRVLK